MYQYLSNRPPKPFKIGHPVGSLKSFLKVLLAFLAGEYKPIPMGFSNAWLMENR
jgi:hypothetical protein